MEYLIESSRPFAVVAAAGDESARGDVVRGGLAAIGGGNDYVHYESLSVDSGLGTGDTHVGSYLGFPHILGHNHSILSGLSRFSGLAYSLTSVFSGDARVMEGSSDQHQPGEGEADGTSGRPKHQFCPSGHFFLGIQIVYITLLLPLAFYGIYLGYRIADSALDSLERGKELFGFGLLLLGRILALISAGLIPGFGYRLAFEAGLGYPGTLLGLSG